MLYSNWNVIPCSNGYTNNYLEDEVNNLGITNTELDKLIDEWKDVDEYYDETEEDDSK